MFGLSDPTAPKGESFVQKVEREKREKREQKEAEEKRMVELEYAKYLRETGKAPIEDAEFEEGGDAASSPSIEAANQQLESSAAALGLKGGDAKALLLSLGRLATAAGVTYVLVSKAVAFLRTKPWAGKGSSSSSSSSSAQAKEHSSDAAAAPLPVREPAVVVPGVVKGNRDPVAQLQQQEQQQEKNEASGSHGITFVAESENEADDSDDDDDEDGDVFASVAEAHEEKRAAREEAALQQAQAQAAADGLDDATEDASEDVDSDSDGDGDVGVGRLVSDKKVDLSMV